ncbi:Pex19-domain-containing protein [Lactarius hatsudake]|nr:Pex19-domain-containing protein [Lactarius hatsudake]
MASNTSQAQEKRPVSVDDDSDVDDLDDVLDAFGKQTPVKPALQTTTSSKPSTPPAASITPPVASGTPSKPSEDDNFAEVFEREMAAMLRDLVDPQGPSSSAAGKSASDAPPVDDPERDRAIREAWEKMLEKSMDDAFSGLTDDQGATNEPEDAFQKNVKEAMERLRQSDTDLQADASAPPADELSAILGSLGEFGDDESIQNLLEGMMGQLMGKDVLYEPLKELNEKFPSYLSSNEDKLSPSDLARYRAQHTCASKIVAIFEDSKYRDDDPKTAADVVTLMTEMQEHGAPPAEIMGELPSGLELGPDGAPQLPEGCVVI